MLVLVDTSSWVEALRPRGKTEVRQRVFQLIENDEAAWCDAVRLELWNYRGGSDEAKRLIEFEEVIPTLAMTSEVWAHSIKLAQRARLKGITVPAIDLLVAACAVHHHVKIESCDKHFEQLAALK